MLVHVEVGRGEQRQLLAAVEFALRGQAAALQLGAGQLVGDPGVLGGVVPAAAGVVDLVELAGPLEVQVGESLAALELGGGLLPGGVVGIELGEPGAGERGVLGVLPAQLIGGAHLLGDVGGSPRLLAVGEHGRVQQRSCARGDAVVAGEGVDRGGVGADLARAGRGERVHGVPAVSILVRGWLELVPLAVVVAFPQPVEHALAGAGELGLFVVGQGVGADDRDAPPAVKDLLGGGKVVLGTGAGCGLGELGLELRALPGRQLGECGPDGGAGPFDPRRRGHRASIAPARARERSARRSAVANPWAVDEPIGPRCNLPAPRASRGGTPCRSPVKWSRPIPPRSIWTESY